MNKITMIGNLTRDVDLVKTNSDKSVAKFAIAVPQKFDKKTVDFFNMQVWGTLAETCAKFLKKGSKVAIVGRLENNNYEKSDGTKVTNNLIVVEEVDFLTQKTKEECSNSEQLSMTEISDSDLPF